MRVPPRRQPPIRIRANHDGEVRPAALRGVPVRCIVKDGNPADAIVAGIAEDHPCILVVGVKRASGTPGPHGTAFALLARSRVPVLCVPPALKPARTRPIGCARSERQSHSGLMRPGVCKLMRSATPIGGGIRMGSTRLPDSRADTNVQSKGPMDGPEAVGAKREVEAKGRGWYAT